MPYERAGQDQEPPEHPMNTPEVVAQTPCGTIIKWEEMFEVCFTSIIKQIIMVEISTTIKPKSKVEDEEESE